MSTPSDIPANLRLAADIIENKLEWEWRANDGTWKPGKTYGAGPEIAALHRPIRIKPTPNADGWISWSGGDCPVAPETMVEARLRDTYRIKDRADNFRWKHVDLSGDILAYRIVKPAWRLPDPPPGKQWHRNDWTEEMLPDGWRPLLLGEEEDKNHDEWFCPGDKTWHSEPSLGGASPGDHHRRTRRPAPTPPLWSCLADVPPGTVWIREKGTTTTCSLMVAVDTVGIYTWEHDPDDAIVLWDRLGKYEWSPDRVNWKPCETEEKA